MQVSPVFKARITTTPGLGLLTLFACLAAFPVHATVTTPFTDALMVWHTPDVVAPDFFGFSDVRHVQAGATAPAVATNSYAGADAWGSVNGDAQADLATGTLKSRTAINFVAPPDPALYMQSNAKFGDGFRTTTGSGTPFSWNANDGARFHMHLTGETTSSLPLTTLGAGAFLFLSILQPNTLDPAQNPAAGPNVIKSYLYLLGNSDLNLVSCANSVCVPVVPEASFTDFSGGIDIDQDIHPGGDFDWVILLGGAGWLYQPSSYDLDFSHTLTVAYQGPVGSVTSSVSTVFGNIGSLSAVPEPTSLALVFAALAVVWARSTPAGKTGRAALQPLRPE